MWKGRGSGGGGEKYTQNGGMRREGKTCEEELGTERHRMKGFKKDGIETVREGETGRGRERE